MKRLFFAFTVAALMLCACSKPVDVPVDDKGGEKEEQPAKPQYWKIKVMSYNIRVPSKEANPDNDWPVRKVGTPAMIKAQRPTVFGLQEAVTEQIKYILDNVEGYSYYGLGRDNGKAIPSASGEIMAIFWDDAQVSVLDWGTFWLSDTPDKVSKGWDAACRRTATWCRFKHKESGKDFLYVNTHLDHKGATARKEGLKLVVSKIAELNTDKLPVILTGDFNVPPTDECVEVLRSTMRDARVTSPVTDQYNTYNAWTPEGKRIIDYIWYSGFDGILSYHTVRDPYAGVALISDHYPITAQLVIKNK
ncbi:MAG: endonuclease/exonuclease/phosphatase family protein [Bacteroidales bacterium]|nr:endonuclease/exonuclease/phosphatase family protein [Bacteroidales bacterium]